MNRSLPLDLMATYLAIVEAGTMIAASDSIGRTPSAVSLQMKRLEDSTGVRLFRRAGRTIELTPAGRVLAAFARQIIDTSDAALLALQGSSAAGRYASASCRISPATC